MGKAQRERQHSKLGWWGGCILECLRLAGALDRVGAGTRGSGWEGVFRVPEHASSKAVASASTPNLGDGAAVFWSASGLPELWDRVGAGTRGSGWEGVFCVPERASSKEVASAQAPALQTWVAGRLCFGVLPACRSFGLRRSRNSWERPNELLYSVPYREFPFGGLWVAHLSPNRHARNRLRFWPWLISTTSTCAAPALVAARRRPLT